MKSSAYVALSGTLFGLIAIVHLVRLLFAWPVQVAQQTIPVWYSGVGLVLAGLLCVWALRLIANAPASDGGS